MKNARNFKRFYCVRIVYNGFDFAVFRTLAITDFSKWYIDIIFVVSETIMSDAAAKPAKKAVKKVKKPAEHPKYSEMIKQAVASLKERNGSSRQAIAKYVKANFKVSDGSDSHIKLALKRMVAGGDLVQVKGTGASGSFKLAKAAPKTKATPKKPAAKKPAAKKATKKPASKKPAAKAKTPSKKKSTPKKKAKPAKKPASAKKPAKKAAKKPAQKKKVAGKGKKK